MKKIFSPLCLSVLLALCSCTTSGLKVSYSDSDAVTQSRSLNGFEKITVLGSPTVYYTQADSFSVSVKGPSDYVDNILTDVDDGTLTIRNKGKVGMVNVGFIGDRHLSVFVTSPDLVGVCVSGSGDLISRSKVDTDVMDIQLRGSGDIEISDLICDRCNVELVGSGDLDIDHLDTREVTATLVGSGDIDINQANVVNTRLWLRGSGDIEVNFLGGCSSVDAELLGSGDITLKGQVKNVSKQKRGSGDIDTSKLRVVE